jgi:hypothetical protein
VHASEVLGEEILPIEIVATTLRSIRLSRGILGCASLGLSACADIALPVLQIKVLAVNMSLPFILVAKGRSTASERESANIGSSVCCCHVLDESRGVFGTMVTCLTLILRLRTRDGLGDFVLFLGWR